MAAIVAADIKVKYSVAAAAGNTTVGTAAGSLGDQISTTEVVTTLHGMFPQFSSAENAASTSKYRCVFIHNANTANAAADVTVYLENPVAGGSTVTIATDNAAASLIGSASTQAATIGAETTAPSGVSAFSAPSTASTGLSLGTIQPGYCRAVWIKNTAGNTTAINADGAELVIHGSTGAL